MSTINQENKVLAIPGQGQAGKFVVLGVIVVAVAAASFALYWNMSRGRRALAFWGAEDVARIQYGKSVELWPLEPVSLSLNPSGKSIFSTPGRDYEVNRHLDISQARGLVHARHALTIDASFTPDEPEPLTAGNWTHVVKFGNETGNVFTLLDSQNRRIAHYRKNEQIKVIPKIAEGWQAFVERQK